MSVVQRVFSIASFPCVRMSSSFSYSAAAAIGGAGMAEAPAAPAAAPSSRTAAAASAVSPYHAAPVVKVIDRRHRPGAAQGRSPVAAAPPSAAAAASAAAPAAPAATSTAATSTAAAYSPLATASPHTHLQRIDFGVNYASHKHSNAEVAGILREAKGEGVEAVVCIANSIPESLRNVELAGLYPLPPSFATTSSPSSSSSAASPPSLSAVFCFTSGCHPHNAKSFKGKVDLDLMRAQILAHPVQCVAVGECGLDYNRNFSPQDVQRGVFRAQVRLAKELGKRLYLHCRDAFDDFAAILREEQVTRGVVHCFTGSLEEARVFIGMGLHIGITGFILDARRNAATAAAIADPSIPIDRLLVETDAPYMAVRPRRVSKPADTALVIAEIARLKQMDVHECARRIHANTIQFITT